LQRRRLRLPAIARSKPSASANGSKDDLHHRPGEPVEPGAVATSLDDPVPAGDEEEVLRSVASSANRAAIFSARSAGLSSS